MSYSSAREKLINRLAFSWKNPKLLDTAFTHTSYANEAKPALLENNQRLEFLGDAVLELVVSDFLYRTYQQEEGVLTKMRAAVVCEPSLARIAQNLELGQVLRLGKGEERTGGRERPAALADAFEALVGAIYLDQGFEKARSFILEHLTPEIAIYAEGNHTGDFKSELQEFVQQFSEQPVSYVILEEVGPDHNKRFTAGVKYRDNLWGKGQGRTKKEAEQIAAEDALKMLRTKQDLPALFSR